MVKNTKASRLSSMLLTFAFAISACAVPGTVNSEGKVINEFTLSVQSNLDPLGNYTPGRPRPTPAECVEDYGYGSPPGPFDVNPPILCININGFVTYNPYSSSKKKILVRDPKHATETNSDGVICEEKIIGEPQIEDLMGIDRPFEVTLRVEEECDYSSARKK